MATLCAYDVVCLTPRLNPILVTFGSPPVGNIDFAIDFNKVMVERNEYHPRTRYLRSIRVVARTKDGKLDAVSASPRSCRTTFTSIRGSSSPARPKAGWGRLDEGFVYRLAHKEGQVRPTATGTHLTRSRKRQRRPDAPDMPVP